MFTRGYFSNHQLKHTLCYQCRQTVYFAILKLFVHAIVSQQ